MDVLDHDDRRRAPRDGREERAPRRVQVVPDLSRFHVVESTVRVGEADRVGEGRGRDRRVRRHLVGQELAAELADLLDREVGVVAVEDAGVSLQDLGERPVRDPVAIGQTSPPKHGRHRVRPIGPHQELPGQSALAYPGVAVDRDEPGPSFGDRSRVDGPQDPQVRIAPYHRRLQAGHAAHDLGCNVAIQQKAANRLGLAFQLEGPEIDQGNVRDRSGRPLAEHHGPGLGGGLQARSRVHDIAGHHRLARPRRGRREHLAGVHPDPDLEPHVVASGQVLVHDLEAGKHPRGRAERPGRIVLVRDRDAERGHDRVTDELLDRATFRFDLLPHRVEVGLQDLAEAFGVELFPQRRRPGHVGEQDRDELALAGRPACLGGHGGAAHGTKRGSLRQHGATGPAGL